MTTQYLAIYDNTKVALGSLEDIIYQVKAFNPNIEPLVFEEENCKRVDFSWYGDAKTVLANALAINDSTLKGEKIEAPAKRGRPKLGVKAKEVTLLPRHWQWLSTQKGGASAALRRLVDDAINNPSLEETISAQQQQLDTFMMAFLGDEPGFEEASRALYRNSKISFEAQISAWPEPIKTFVMMKFMRISKLHNGELDNGGHAS